jgi:hypothetical protein
MRERQRERERGVPSFFEFLFLSSFSLLTAFRSKNLVLTVVLLQLVEGLLCEPHSQQGVFRERVGDGAPDSFDCRDGSGRRRRRKRRGRRSRSRGAFAAKGNDRLPPSGQWAPTLVSRVRRGRRADAFCFVSFFEQQAREREAAARGGGAALGPDLERAQADDGERRRRSLVSLLPRARCFRGKGGSWDGVEEEGEQEHRRQWRAASAP